MSRSDTDAQEGADDLTIVECLSCGRRIALGPAHSGAGAVPLASLTRRLRCSVCGSRAVRAERPRTPQDVARALRRRMDGDRPAS